MNADIAFTQCVSMPERALDLARAALLIACEEYPQLDVDAYLARLDIIATAVRARLPAYAGVEDILLVLNQYLFEEQGFTGNVEDYYDPRNSFLNEVLDRKLGIPISLSVLYIEVGRRLGIPLEGVAFPGHFLVKLHLNKGDVVLDPFFGGVSLSEADLTNRIAGILGAPGSLRPDLLRQMLETTGKKEILARILRNLKTIYLHKQDLPRALSVSNQILTTLPHSAPDIRDRGIILEYLECARAAAADYRHYLTLAPNAEDHEEIRSRMLALQQVAPWLN